ncbi:DUF1801 domain-containing protein [uncultured Vagococcus sp.]|uniref:iron chaperone n=1 Tax=uncultured Vagococcus sp. TaxID=189676 RepID=UPI0028D74CB2|nr:DUF1801 domain-containing protein [uncultured Vagococcus sp.]
MIHSQDITDYIHNYPADIQDILTKTRETIQAAAPDSVEKISYQMPTYYLNGNLVHFAAAKKHLGFYPTPSAISEFSEDLAPYKTSKGAVQFPYAKEIPYDLISKMVTFRVKENTASSH